MLKPCLTVYGENFDDATWFADSPVAQVSTITCPVSVYFSTADVLVPINQVVPNGFSHSRSHSFPMVSRWSLKN